MEHKLFIEAFDKTGKSIASTPVDPNRRLLKKNAKKWTNSITGAATFEVRRTKDYQLILSGSGADV